uniref:Bm10076, isoform a n=2 Tax=Brugia malayi TaxID=6279 RepID=A0A0J9XVS9_BRUMA|nr:Bm10076, isoform a [Brugia malayi]
MKYIKYSGIKKTFEGKTYGMNLLKKIKIFKKGDGNAEDVKREQRENKQANSQPAFTMEQASKALKAYKNRKKARQKAREEEACYVEYRKAEILAKFKPKVGALRSADEVFPKRRKGSMGFGERKAHYLSIRPKPCYATWLGRRRNIIEAKPSPMAIAASVDMTDHSAVPEFSRQSVKESDKENNESDSVKKSLASKDSKHTPQISISHIQKESQKRSSMIGPEFEGDSGLVKMATYGAHADNPLINGVPFWTIETPQEEEAVTDDDLPVDMDILEKVCTGKKTLDSRPFEKIEFNPFGPVSKMKADDMLFDRDTILFSNTVETVIRLQPEDDERRAKPADPLRRRIRWADKISVTTFDPKNRRPKDIRTPINEPLRNIARDRSSIAC